MPVWSCVCTMCSIQRSNQCCADIRALCKPAQHSAMHRRYTETCSVRIHQHIKLYNYLGIADWCAHQQRTAEGIWNQAVTRFTVKINQVTAERAYRCCRLSDNVIVVPSGSHSNIGVRTPVRSCICVLVWQHASRDTYRANGSAPHRVTFCEHARM